MWISGSVVPLVQFADCVRAISSTQLDLVGIGLEFPLELARRLGEFDEIVTWYGSNRAEFREAMTALHPRCEFLQALPGKDWREHAADFFLKQVGGEKGQASRIAVDAEEPRRNLVIHPFSGSASKNWPLDRYRKFAERLPVPVDWIAGPDERLDGARRFENLLKLGCWMRGATVYVGNDSGISHLAAALGIPSVVIFGPTDPAIWAPRGANVGILRGNPLDELPVATVIRAVEQLL